MNTIRQLPLRTGVLILFLLLGWGLAKIQWEHQLKLEQVQMLYHGLNLPRGIREQMGQGATLATLAGMRALVANYFWVVMEGYWERREWFKVKNCVDLVTTLEPRSITFWDGGAHQFAWNAALDCRRNPAQPIEILRLRDERFWVNQGIQLLERGIANNPEKMNLWYLLGWIYEQRKQDYLKAAYYYQEALRRPHPPQFLERFVGYDLEKGGDLTGAYNWWKQIWFSTTDRSQKFRAWDIVERHLRHLEDTLQIPPEKRVFPEAKIRDANQK